MTIELLWGSKELWEYMSKLIILDHYDRQGFDQPSFDCLLKIFLLHEEEFPEFFV